MTLREGSLTALQLTPDSEHHGKLDGAGGDVVVEVAVVAAAVPPAHALQPEHPGVQRLRVDRDPRRGDEHLRHDVISSAANRLIGEVVQSQRRPLLGPSPG